MLVATALRVERPCMIEARMGAHPRICGSTAMVGSSIIAADFLLAFDISKQCTYDERCTPSQPSVVPSAPPSVSSSSAPSQQSKR